VAVVAIRVVLLGNTARGRIRESVGNSFDPCRQRKACGTDDNDLVYVLGWVFILAFLMLRRGRGILL
jgi:hypothetical protein